MKNFKKVHGHKLIKVPEAQIPGNLKLNLEEQAGPLIETVLKPAYITPPPENTGLAYITDIYFMWQDHYFYFCAEYRCPHPPKSPDSTASPTYESKFARLEYVGDVRFNLSYLSHTGNWVKIFIDLTVRECMEAIKNDSFFYPSPPCPPVRTVQPGRRPVDIYATN